MNEHTEAALMRAGGQIEALQHQVQQLRAEVAELDFLRERMGDILTRTAIALRGQPPELVRWSWHDLPERAAAAVASIAVMQEAARINGEAAASLERVRTMLADDATAITFQTMGQYRSALMGLLTAHENVGAEATPTAQPLGVASSD